jgi:hypothetical protein
MRSLRRCRVIILSYCFLDHENFNRSERLKEIIFDLNKEEEEDLVDINEICKIFTLRSIQIDNEKYANKTYYQVIFF